ncbi:MAG: hypothetical protein PQJ28_00525 [Spirochaetales bacterium]|nr:hypothetical protein [Spirochaetales bacterium]
MHGAYCSGNANGVYLHSDDLASTFKVRDVQRLSFYSETRPADEVSIGNAVNKVSYQIGDVSVQAGKNGECIDL